MARRIKTITKLMRPAKPVVQRDDDASGRNAVAVKIPRVVRRIPTARADDGTEP